MLWKKIALTAAAGAALTVAFPASANPPYWAPAHGYRDSHRYYDNQRHRRHYGYYPRHREKVVVIEQPYYRAPKVVVLNPAPVYAPYPYPPSSPTSSLPGWDVNVGFRFGGDF
jgi:hypothetical protein